METAVAELIVNVVTNWPWVIYVYATGFLGATFIRGAWPEEEQRAPWLRGVLADCDVLQLNLSGPVRTAMSKKQAQ
jgi:hypothetical protein